MLFPMPMDSRLIFKLSIRASTGAKFGTSLLEMVPSVNSTMVRLDPGRALFTMKDVARSNAVAVKVVPKD